MNIAIYFNPDPSSLMLQCLFTISKFGNRLNIFKHLCHYEDSKRKFSVLSLLHCSKLTFYLTYTQTYILYIGFLSCKCINKKEENTVLKISYPEPSFSSIFSSVCFLLLRTFIFFHSLLHTHSPSQERLSVREEKIKLFSRLQ